MITNFKLEGAAELLRRLKDLPKAVQRPTVIETLKASAEPMRRGMAQRINRSNKRHAHLADHIVVAPARGKKDEITVAVGPRADLSHRARFLEYGTVRMSARPFARPAFDTQGGRAIGATVQELWHAIKRAVGSRSTSGGGL